MAELREAVARLLRQLDTDPGFECENLDFEEVRAALTALDADMPPKDWGPGPLGESRSVNRWSSPEGQEK